MAVAIRARGREVEASARPRLAPLLAAGAALEVILLAGILMPMRLDRHPPSLHTNLASVYGLDGRGLALYLALAGALLLAYGAAVVTARRAPPSALPVALLLAAVFGLTLVPAHPTYSSDVFHYIATARVDLVHGENPHVTPPEAFPDDPWTPRSGWKWLPSPYGPGWSLLSALPLWASGGVDAPPERTVAAFKLLVVLCAVGAAAGIALAAERIRPGWGVPAAVLFGWNPLLLTHVGADGHNDAAMLLLMAWGAFALASGRRAIALALLATACLIKPAAGLAALVLLIVLIRRRQWRAAIAGLGAAAAVAILAYAPYWAGSETFRGMLDEGRYFTNTLASLVQRVLEPALGGDPARWVVGGAVRLALIALLIRAALTVRDRPDELLAADAWLYLLAATLLATWYQPWYALWPLLFVAAIAWRSRLWIATALALTAGGLLVPVAVNFAAELSGRGARDWLVDALAVLLAHGPLILIGLAAFVGRAALTPRPPLPMLGEGESWQTSMDSPPPRPGLGEGAGG